MRGRPHLRGLDPPAPWPSAFPGWILCGSAGPGAGGPPRRPKLSLLREFASRVGCRCRSARRALGPDTVEETTSTATSHTKIDPKKFGSEKMAPLVAAWGSSSSRYALTLFAQRRAMALLVTWLTARAVLPAHRPVPDSTRHESSDARSVKGVVSVHRTDRAAAWTYLVTAISRLRSRVLKVCGSALRTTTSRWSCSRFRVCRTL